jgi:acetolactate synthase I/II/III large subunit
VLVFEALADAFAAQRVRAVFTIMGDGNKLWLVAAADRGMRLLHARHEGAALAMADGYARLSGEVGVCSVTYGPGITQLATSLGVAAKHGTPLVVFAADVADDDTGHGQQLAFDAAGLVASTGAGVRRVRSAASATEDVHLAFHEARLNSRPVVLLVRSDIQAAVQPPEAADRISAALPWPPPPSVPCPEQVGYAAEVLTRAERPVIVAGLGAVAAGAGLAVRDLARRAGALMGTTLPAKGFLAGECYDVGVVGGFSTRRAARLLERADAVVAVGASLSWYTRGHGAFFGHATVVHVDTDPGAATPGALLLRGDAALGTAALAAALPDRELERPGWREAPVAAGLASAREDMAAAQPVPVSPGEVDPRLLMLAADKAMGPDTTVTIGVGHFTSFPATYLGSGRGRRFLPVLDFICIGQAVPTAVGAAVAGGAPVIAVEGDASFLMHVQEIETAARYRLPILVLVMNDGVLGAEYHKLRALGVDPAESIVPPPDLAAVASSLGARATTLTHLDQVDKIFDWFDPDLGPHVVDCRVTRRVVGPL